jgi:glucose/mannose-6-phosphate isomerase
MIDLERLQKYDISGMYKIYDQWPSIAKKSFSAEHQQIEFKNIDNIVFAGMGGSGSLGDVLKSILSKTDLHTTTVKGYLLPKTVNQNSLIVVISVSGNTVESYNILQFAHKNNFKTICFSSGGKIEEFCNKNKIPHRLIERIQSPRDSFVQFLFSMLKVLQTNIPIKNGEITETISELEKLGNKINSNNLNESNPAISLAEWITDIPMIYYPWGLQAAAIRFKNSLQENAKMHAMSEDIVEASHNGIVSWERPSNVKPILIQGKDDFIKTKERWSIIKEYFVKSNIDYREVFTVGDSILSKMVSLIYFLDYCSIYKSIMFGIDPSPVTSIDFIKKRL